MIELKNVYKTYNKNESQAVLDGISFKVKEGTTLGIMGQSGSGKSTIAKILLLLEPMNSGELYYAGEKINPKNQNIMRHYRQNVQYISQHPESFFDPTWKLGQSIKEIIQIHKMGNQAHTRLEILLSQVKLNDHVLDRYPYQVSGGEIQRLALCRALLLNPRVLILDEVTSMLDVSVQAQILSILKEIQTETGMTYLMISHDYEVLNWFTEHIKVLTNGKLGDFRLPAIKASTLFQF
ncbi:ABC transporter ATP-binding protein [Fusibacter sp. 3D3]|uniref:ABC transporter ATP-binding protein n=1 Tax=Fusibacter sp. 3D3 TaxID=1048380 RepID=UPI0008531D0D|nr:dipeptide/oligopeptide/nickel ABC transporter ATP-binding protein [Fusibacter sp. 3D3]GAU76491.1 oligopeptide transport ATP-binding protein OppF [Fusibacter sp. 3D3]